MLFIGFYCRIIFPTCLLRTIIHYPTLRKENALEKIHLKKIYHIQKGHPVLSRLEPGKSDY